MSLENTRFVSKGGWQLQRFCDKQPDARDEAIVDYALGGCARNREGGDTMAARAGTKRSVESRGKTGAKASKSTPKRVTATGKSRRSATVAKKSASVATKRSNGTHAPKSATVKTKSRKPKATVAKTPAKSTSKPAKAPPRKARRTDRVTELERALKAANTRIAELERQQTEVLNRLDWAIENLRQSLETVDKSGSRRQIA